jgi:hypothetical protein
MLYPAELLSLTLRAAAVPFTLNLDIIDRLGQGVNPLPMVLLLLLR